MDRSSAFFFTPTAEISDQFTEIEKISSSGFNILLRAKRNGQWWILKAQNSDVRRCPEYQGLLDKEYDILSRLQHPGIVRVESLEEVGEYGRCIVMEWIDGDTLDQWLEQKHSRAERQHVAEQLLAAVEYVHDQQVVHRDLKPSNIMITHNGGALKLIDFGLSDTDNYAILKQPAGTDGFVSPEQQKEEIPDVRNDIYSLGIIFRQMRLGWSYRMVTRHCLLPLEQRFSNVHSLRQHLRCYHRRLVTGVALMSLLIVAALGAVIYNKVYRSSIGYDKVVEFQLGNLHYVSWGGGLLSVSAANDKDSCIEVPASVYYQGIHYMVDEVGDSAFANLPSLRHVMLPNRTGLHVMKHILAGSAGVESIVFRSKTPPVLGNAIWPVKMGEVFNEEAFGQITLLVPKGSAETYRRSPWGRFKHIEEYD